LTARIDPATVLDEAASVKLGDVFEKGQGRPWAAKSGGERKMIAVGKAGHPRAFVVVRRRRRRAVNERTA
jgi:hypothetical protein